MKIEKFEIGKIFHRVRTKFLK